MEFQLTIRFAGPFAADQRVLCKFIKREQLVTMFIDGIMCNQCYSNQPSVARSVTQIPPNLAPIGEKISHVIVVYNKGIQELGQVMIYNNGQIMIGRIGENGPGAFSSPAPIGWLPVALQFLSSN
jgi:hypothetical protein